MTADTWDAMMDINLRAPVLLGVWSAFLIHVVVAATLGGLIGQVEAIPSGRPSLTIVRAQQLHGAPGEQRLLQETGGGGGGGESQPAGGHGSGSQSRSGLGGTVIR